MSNNTLKSFAVLIDMSHAVLSNAKFAKISGISKLSQGRVYAEWTKADKEVWAKKHSSIGHLFRISINYLSSEESFFVRPSKINPYIKSLGHKTRLYHETVAGDSFSEELQLSVYTRAVEKCGWCFTVALYWNNGKRFSKEQKEEFTILCDFPLEAATAYGDKVDKAMESLEFKFERNQSIEGRTDEFGDYVHPPESIVWEKMEYASH